MSFKPIPKHLLIHEVLYQAPKSEDDGSMGSGELPKAQRIEHVRFTPKRKRIIKTDNTEVLTNGVLYIDAVNSKPFVNPKSDERKYELKMLDKTNMWKMILGIGASAGAVFAFVLELIKFFGGR